MKKVFGRNKKSVIYAWGLSYGIIFLIPFFATFVSYYYNVRLIRKEVVSANELVLDNLANRIDEYFDEITELYININSHEEFKKWVANPTKTPQFYKDTYELKTQLPSFYDSSSYSYLLYNLGCDYVLNPVGACDKNSYYDSLAFYNPDMLNFEEWCRTVSRKYVGEYIKKIFSLYLSVPC